MRQQCGTALVPAVGLAMLLQACASWQQPRQGDGGALKISSEHPLRVTLVNGNELLLSNPRVVGDSIVGELGYSAERMAVSLKDVKRLQERRVSAGRTAAAGAGIGAGAVVLYGIISMVVLLAIVSAL